MRSICIILFCLIYTCFAFAQNQSNHGHKFEQLDQILRSPNSYRTADGSPGPDYWQQQADYKIKCTLDVKVQKLDGSETITYTNNSPSGLKYLWLQLDENEHSKDALKHHNDDSKIYNIMNEKAMQSLEVWRLMEDYGVKLKKLRTPQENL